MKIRNILPIVLAVLLLAGCSAKSYDGAPMDNYYAGAESGIYDAAEQKVEVEASSNINAPLTDRKLIKTVDLEAETEDLDALLAVVAQRVTELGGYVENQRVYNGSAYASRRSRSASMTIRIPADMLEGFVDHVASHTNIVSRYVNVDDVTLTYVATESRVEALEAEQARLLELMAKAETMADLLEVEARLTDVRYELESVTSQMNVLKNQVSYGTVNLNVDEVVEYTPVEEETFWQRISGGFMDSLRGIGDGFVEFTVFILANLPYLALIGAGAAAVILLAKRSIRKRKAKKNSENQK